MSAIPTVPQPYLYFGDLYLAAAFQLARHSDATFMPALLQLFGTGVELTLKAFLVHAQVQPDKLKRIGHQLGDALDLALANGLATWEPQLGKWPATETIHTWAQLYAGDKTGPNKNHRRLLYPIAEDHQWGFGVGDAAIARTLVRAVAGATGYDKRLRLYSLEPNPHMEGTMAALLVPPTAGPFAGC